VEYRTIGLSDHAERWLVERGRVFFDAAERPSRFVGFTIDITDWKRLEEQFRHAQKMDSIGRLAGGIAHDFNNLLTVISGYGQMTLDELPTHHPLRGGVQEVLKAAAQATSLTRQLLTFSRRHAARTETIDLNELVADIQKMLGRLIGEDVKLTISMDPAAGAFRGDRTHIEQVIMNLVVNAKDAMPRGGTLSIETGPIEVDTRFAEAHVDVAAGRYTALTVTDTGTGMSPEVKSQIFEPFFTTKEHGKGTGLGLSMVYGIVKQCGATISVESEPGQGTAFRVLFPTVEFEPQDAQPDSPVAAAPGSETILLAEDEPGVRSYVRATLEQNGYRVLDCGNGREAVERARQHAGPIHLLVTDGVMPEMGGMELAKEFSACRPGIPVLCMSGYSDQVWSFAAAPTSYIQKPFTPTAILSQIRTLLDQQSGGV
jgi:signal transduction histidine kinase/CheY-like chemotaxis protein